MPGIVMAPENKHSVPGMRFQQVLKYLQNQQCGYEGNDPKVICPKSEDLSEEEFPIPRRMSPSSHLEEITLKMGGVIDTPGGIKTRSCSGSITIIHYDRLGSQPLHDMKALKLKGKRYSHIRKLSSNREIIRVRSEGNCCWRIFNRIGHTGQIQKISPGFDEKPNIKIKSVTRTSC